MTCPVAGDLTIRGTTRPFAMTMKVSADRGTFRVAGAGTVKLSEYGIDKPSQLGVATSDDVMLRLDFTATSPAPQLSRVAAGAP
jgi:polyisoprenoid-binding protein YceI